MNDRIFYKNGYYCKVNRDIGESYEDFINRGNFVVSQKFSTIEQYNKILTLSRIWVNIKYNNSSYRKEIHKDIINMEKNL